MNQQEKFDIWALVELFGHSRIAGRVTERNVGGASFLQVDVPDTKYNPSFTRLLNPSAIYAINPVTEEVAKYYAENLNVKPIESWDINKFMEKAKQNQIAAQSTPAGEEEEDETDRIHRDY
jgi:hypothetical protein